MSYALVLETLLGASIAVTLVLTALVAVRKHRRDRNEAAFAARRERLRRSLLEHDAPALRACLREAMVDADAQVDVAVTLDAVWPSLAPEAIDLLSAAAAETGLIAAAGAAAAHEDPMVRGRAIVLLSRLRCETAVSTVAPLVSDPDPDVRLAAAGSLDAIGDADAAWALIEALADEALPAERIIERLGRPWAVDAVLDAITDHRLAEKPRTDGRSVRGHLATALGLAGDPRAEGALLSLLETESVEERIAAARALGTTGTFRAAAALLMVLADEAWPVRAQAAKSLGALGDPVAVPALERALGDEAWWVRSNSAAALRRLGEPGIAALQRALASDDRFARERAREELDLAGLARREAS